MKVWLEYGMEAPCIFAAEEWKKYAVKVFSDVTEIECKRARKAGNVNAQYSGSGFDRGLSIFTGVRLSVPAARDSGRVSGLLSVERDSCGTL